MMMLILIALFIEAIVSAIKPLWSRDGERMSVAEIVSIIVGVLLAVTCRLDILRLVAGDDILANSPPWVEYIFYVMSGVAIGRGPSFLWDLWQKIKELDGNKSAANTEPAAPALGPADDFIDLEITHWTLDQLREFCILNDIPTDGCISREDYMDAIEHGGRVSDEPPGEGPEPFEEPGEI